MPIIGDLHHTMPASQKQENVSMIMWFLLTYELLTICMKITRQLLDRDRYKKALLAGLFAWRHKKPVVSSKMNLCGKLIGY